MGQWPRSVVGGVSRTTRLVGRQHRHPAQTDSHKPTDLEGAGSVAGIGYHAVSGSGNVVDCCCWELGQGEQQPQLLHYGPNLVHIHVVSAQNNLFWSNAEETRRFAPSNPDFLRQCLRCGSHDKTIVVRPFTGFFECQGQLWRFIQGSNGVFVFGVGCASA